MNIDYAIDILKALKLLGYESVTIKIMKGAYFPIEFTPLWGTGLQPHKSVRALLMPLKE
jgi:hypothetical protein